MMFSHYSAATVFMLVTAITATHNVSLSNTLGAYPSNPKCPPSQISPRVQAAECSHNTRLHDKQIFAIFIHDPKFDSSHGAPYGTCKAYDCDPQYDMTQDEYAWTFYWNKNSPNGTDDGDGAGCIKSPVDGTCGCENSNGAFVYGGTDCK